MTPEQLHRIMPYASAANCARFSGHLVAAMDEFGIDTALRRAYFLAQIAHESASLATTSEYDTGGAYEGRRDLGNDQPGDGVKYKGHGLIQTTGKANHFRVADYFGVDRAAVVEWLKSPEGAARSAGLFWRDNNCNVSADADNIRANTRIVNGGYNGLSERVLRLGEAKSAIIALGLWSMPDFSDVQSGSSSTAS